MIEDYLKLNEGDVRWMEKSACRGMDTDRFFPEDGAEMKEVVEEFCDICPVREECLDYAITNKIPFGIWGGVSQRERTRQAKALRRDRALAKIALNDDES